MFKLLTVLLVALILCMDAAWAKEYKGEVIYFTQELQEAHAAYENKDYAIAIEKYKIVVNKNNLLEKSIAMFSIGSIYYFGHIPDEDYKESMHWFKLAATEGNPSAQYALGWLYENGKVVQQDYPEAIRWYKLAAAQGLADAQFNLSLLYYFGRGVVQNYSEALHWTKLAAAQGEVLAQFNLGTMYGEGQAVSKDYAESIRWHKLAAEQGHAGSLVNTWKYVL